MKQLSTLSTAELIALKHKINKELANRTVKPSIDLEQFEEWLWEAPETFKNVREAYKSYGLAIGLHQFGQVFKLHYRRVSRREGRKMIKLYQRYTYIPE